MILTNISATKISLLLFLLLRGTGLVLPTQHDEDSQVITLHRQSGQCHLPVYLPGPGLSPTQFIGQHVHRPSSCHPVALGPGTGTDMLTLWLLSLL